MAQQCIALLTVRVVCPRQPERRSNQHLAIRRILAPRNACHRVIINFLLKSDNSLGLLSALALQGVELLLFMWSVCASPSRTAPGPRPSSNRNAAHCMVTEVRIKGLWLPST